MGRTKIEWTNATWNPVRGCSVLSEGCRNCYAMKLAHRFSGEGAAYDGLTRLGRHGPVWTGDVRLVEEHLEDPLHWRDGRLVFVNSMADLFHEKVPTRFIERVFEVMRSAPQHQFQVLTKRSRRLRELAPSLAFPQNVWMGVSVESAAEIDRIRDLQAVQCSVRFLSVEPLLGPIPNLPLEGIHWVIAGGESGAGARPMEAAWVRSIRIQCRRARVPFFFKQWGGVHKSKQGRTLDGRTWDEMPRAGSLAAVPR